MKSIKVYVSLLLIFLGLNAYSQYGFIEMKNGEQFEIVDDRFSIDGNQLRYYIEKVESKRVSLFGFGIKKHKQKYLDKTNVVNIDDIKIIHTQGELSVGNTFIANYIGIKYIKIKNNYEEFYVIEDGICSLLIKPGDGNSPFSYNVQMGNEEPFMLHRAGTALGPKYKNKAKKYFADCKPAMEYINTELKSSTLPKLIQIYNANCA